MQFLLAIGKFLIKSCNLFFEESLLLKRDGYKNATGKGVISRTDKGTGGIKGRYRKGNFYICRIYYGTEGKG